MTHFRILQTFILFFLTGTVFSQPVVTIENFPTPGTLLKYYMGNSIGPVNENKGADQTWDFSNIELTLINEVNYVDTRSTNGISGFPSATIAFEAPTGSGDFTYLDISEHQYKYLGFVVNSCEVPVVGMYDDSWIVYSLPLNFNDEFNDSFSSTSTVIQNGDTVKTFFRSDYSYKVDGYGKLITPYKTFPNVLRVFATTQGVDSAIHTGTADTTIVTKYTNEKISWLSTGDDDVFEQVSTFNFTDFFFQDAVKTTSAKDVILKKEGINLFPDPATDLVNVELTGMKMGPLTIKVFNSFGKIILDYYFNNSGMSIINRQVPISGLAPGMYHVKVSSLSGEWQSKFVKQ